MKGARIVLRSMVARSSPTFASAALKFASAVSRSAWEPISVSTRRFWRSRESRVSSSWASAAASCARSCFMSSSTRTSPARTCCPDSKEIFSTIPGRSALTTTPWTAVTVPIAESVVGHCSAFATTVVTASGGGWYDFCWAMPFLIWPYLTAPIAVRKTAIATTISVIRFFMKSQPPLDPAPFRADGPDDQTRTLPPPDSDTK